MKSLSISFPSEPDSVHFWRLIILTGFFRPAAVNLSYLRVTIEAFYLLTFYWCHASMDLDRTVGYHTAVSVAMSLAVAASSLKGRSRSRAPGGVIGQVLETSIAVPISAIIHWIA